MARTEDGEIKDKGVGAQWRRISFVTFALTNVKHCVMRRPRIGETVKRNKKGSRKFCPSVWRRQSGWKIHQWALLSKSGQNVKLE